MSDDESETHFVISSKTRLPRHRSSLEWSLHLAIDARLTESQSLKNRLTDLEELDERRRMAAQHIEAIQRR